MSKLQDWEDQLRWQDTIVLTMYGPGTLTVRAIHRLGYSFLSRLGASETRLRRQFSPGITKSHVSKNRPMHREKLRTSKSVTNDATAAKDGQEGLSLDCLIATIVQGYVPGQDVAGSTDETTPPNLCVWAEVLPDLVKSGANPALVAAIKAFALSILAVRLSPNIDKPTATEAYSSALRSVNDALDTVHGSSTPVLMAAVMCLLFAELLLPTTLESWRAHLEGLGKLIQTYQPKLTHLVSPIDYLLSKTGPVLKKIVLGIQSRKPSFLAGEEWRILPFRDISPSPMQTLMSEAAVIPSILEKLDKSHSMPPELAKLVCGEALSEFFTLLKRLESWQAGFLSSFKDLPYCFRAGGNGGRSRIWFENLTVANGLTHYWAFKVICLTNIDKLLVSYPEMAADARIPGTSMFEETKELSIMMCQSVEYLIQDTMKLFGPTSVLLPLRTAYETFRAGGAQTEDELSWCRGILKAVFQGYNFLTMFFDEFRVEI